MLNKMQHEEQNLIQGGNDMKCSFCGKIFEPAYDENVCEECMHSVDELSNGKGGDDDE